MEINAIYFQFQKFGVDILLSLEGRIANLISRFYKATMTTNSI